MCDLVRMKVVGCGGSFLRRLNFRCQPQCLSGFQRFGGRSLKAGGPCQDWLRVLREPAAQPDFHRPAIQFVLPALRLHGGHFEGRRRFRIQQAGPPPQFPPDLAHLQPTQGPALLLRIVHRDREQRAASTHSDSPLRPSASGLCRPCRQPHRPRPVWQRPRTTAGSPSSRRHRSSAEYCFHCIAYRPARAAANPARTRADVASAWRADRKPACHSSAYKARGTTARRPTSVLPERGNPQQRLPVFGQSARPARNREPGLPPAALMESRCAAGFQWLRFHPFPL